MTGERANYRKRLRERLLQVTQNVLAGEGLSAVQARRIAQEADCSVGTLYNIFGDIDGLILEANERTLKELGERLFAASRRAEGRGLEERLMALAGTYLDFATANQLRWRAIFEHRLPGNRPLPPTYSDSRRYLLGLLDTQLESAVSSANERRDAAFALFSSVHGIVLLSLDAKIADFDPARCEAQMRFIVGHVLRALR